MFGVLFLAGLGQGAVNLTAFTATYRGLTPAQIPPATSANRILQPFGGVFGTVTLAIVLNGVNSEYTPASAFAHTFTWALALTALAVLPAFALPRRPASQANK